MSSGDQLTKTSFLSLKKKAVKMGCNVKLGSNKNDLIRMIMSKERKFSQNKVSQKTDRISGLQQKIFKDPEDRKNLAEFETES